MKIDHNKPYKRKIVLTGGGSAGHVTPNLALIPELLEQGWQIDYIGSEGGVERKMMEKAHIPYHPIQTGKLRRYFSWKNLLDPFRVLAGIVQATILLHRLKPQVIFSKGGFVGLPVVIGGWLNRIPVVAHESDFSMGLANRLSFPFLRTLCVTFAAAKKNIRHKKVVITGSPIREALFHGEREKGLKYCGFDQNKPCLLIIGGGQGSDRMNQCVRQSLGALLARAQVIHLCGPGKTDPHLKNRKGYFQLDYAQEELADLYAASDWVISRSGANSLYELLVLDKPHILIPLPETQSRGDQIQNAHYFQSLGVSYVIAEKDLSTVSLLSGLDWLQAHETEIRKKIEDLNIQSGVQPIMKILQGFSGY